MGKTIDDTPKTWYCIKCGGEALQEKVWQDMNTKEVIDSCGDDEYWCDDCEYIVKITQDKEEIDKIVEDALDYDKSMI